MKTGIASAMVDYPIGDLIAERVRAMGVRPFYKHFKHDGVTGPNMATVYSDRGLGVRAPVVFYNRSNEAAALLKPGDFDWKAIFAGGVRWFHSGGIFAALSPDHRRTGHRNDEGRQGSRRRHFLRSQLPREALEDSRRRYARRRDHRAASSRTSMCWSATKRTCRRASAFPAPKSHAKSKLDPSAFFGMMDNVVKKLPARQDRRHHPARSPLHQPPLAGARSPGSTAKPTPLRPPNSTSSTASAAATASPPASSTACSPARSPRRPLKLGWAHGALLTTFPGDTTMATLDQVRAFAEGGSARIQR